VLALSTALNPIVLENEKPGTPQSVWQVAPGEDSTTIQGFTTEISTSIGGTVDFKIDNLTGVPNYQINIYRLGYYGGDGATLAATIEHQSTSAVVQPAPIVDPTTGEVDAGNWQVTDSWAIPTDATSGVYVANVVEGSQVFQIPFVVKDPSSPSDIVFQTNDETWQAYNGWGGADLYGGNGPAPTGAAYAVSYNRPITTLDSSGVESGPQDSLFGAEYNAIYWMEENGYDVSYISGLDTATDGSLLLNHKIFMDAGHDEYWTDSQVANVQAAANAGVNLAFLSGNEIFWQTQFAPSIDGSDTADRTLVTYKDSHFEQLINPSGQGTGSFLAPTNWGGAAMPSNALTGTVFQVDQTTAGPITVPYGDSLLRFWRNTSVANTAPGQSATLASDLLGYEWDSSPDNGFMPVGLVDLSSTTSFQPTAYNTAFGNVDTSGTATHNLVEYRDPTSGALVFGAGTVYWSWGLADQGVGAEASALPPDPNVQQAMVNLFADMGVQLETLQASLQIATASTDHTPPTSTISNVSTTSPVEGQSVTVTGTATDAGGGVIAAVDVSTDGGKTWHPATSPVGDASENWSYTFAAPAPGTFTIESRAVDDSLNVETPGPGTAYTVSPSTALSLFSPSATPVTASYNDPNAVEVGLKFTSATNGEITGIRFYKGALNTGTHLVDLWSASGTLLATATSTNETASGWQQVNFSNPVNITAGTSYIASYHMNRGEYSDTPYYFDTLNGTTNGSLAAIGDGLNGVFAYSPGSVFPTNVAPEGDNYWVDVVFNDTSQEPQANDDSGFVTKENTAVSIAASALLANDTDPHGLPLSISGVSDPSNGTVIYDPTAQLVTFTPAGGYTGTASFSYAISDTSGQTASGSVAVTVRSTFLYVPNEGDNTVSVVDTINNTVVATIPIGGSAPNAAAVSPDGAFVYVASGNGIVSVINTASNLVAKTIPVGDSPSVVAFSPDGSRAYVTNHVGNDVSVIDTATNSVVATITVDDGPYGVAFSPDGTRAYVTNQTSGTVSVIDTAHNSVVGTITVGSTPTMVAVSPDGTRAYVNDFGSGTVSVISTATNSVIGTINVGSGPYGLVFSPDGTRAYVATNGGTVAVIDTTSNTVTQTINVGQVVGIAISPDGSDLYVSHWTGSHDNIVTVIDTATNAVTGTIQVGEAPEYLAISCFMPGTMVLVPSGEVAVETLKRGDIVITTDGRAAPVSWVGRQTVSPRFADPLRVLPIRIKAGALGDNVPSRDFLLSPDHAILINDVLVQAGALVNGTSITRETNVPPTFTYYHVELDDHALIFAENTPAETFVDNMDRLGFDNWKEHEALYPEGKPIVEMPYPRAKAHRQVPRAIREKLAARGAAFDGEKFSAA
jgi:YVTN family beta-propeller protein